jgi:hypothetical protein
VGSGARLAVTYSKGLIAPWQYFEVPAGLYPPLELLDGSMLEPNLRLRVGIPAGAPLREVQLFATDVPQKAQDIIVGCLASLAKPESWDSRTLKDVQLLLTAAFKQLVAETGCRILEVVIVDESGKLLVAPISKRAHKENEA